MNESLNNQETESESFGHITRHPEETVIYRTDDHRQMEIELARLYSIQAKIKKDAYLHAHSRNRAQIRRHVGTFMCCRNFLEQAHTVLDWGCHHAPGACLVRMLCGPRVQLYGCDVDAETYDAFFSFADLKYTQIKHPYFLSYKDNFFDAVIAEGVLEHVPNDSESLKELYRVIRTGGYLIVSMLPNKSSYTGWLNRLLRNPHHSRLYSLTEIQNKFMHHGFFPVRSGYHQMIPVLSNPNDGIFDDPLANRIVERLFWLNGFFEKIWPINRLASNIFIVGQKVQAFE